MDENKEKVPVNKNNQREIDNLIDLYELGKYEVMEAFKEMKNNLIAMEKEREELLAMKKEKDEEILAVKRVKDEELLAMKKEKDEEIKKFHDFTSLLRSKLECPVCLDVPTSGPVPTCPNGHVVCSKCKQTYCPTCRERMFENKSLLAVAVIENIEHQCKFDGCNSLVPLCDLENHMKTCQFRIISCPAPSGFCGKKVALCKVLDHILTERGGSTNKKDGGELKIFERLPQTWTCWEDSNVPLGDFDMTGTAFQWNEKFFYINFVKANGASVFSILHIGNEEDCKNVKVNITVHQVGDKDMSGDYVHRFAGEPLSIDLSEELRKKNGLSVRNLQLRKIAIKDGDQWNFCVTYNIKQ